jgi:hypothetical protein
VSAPSTRPKPSSGTLRCEATLAKSPHQPAISHAHLMRGSPDILSRHACLNRQGRSDRSHFALSLTDLTGKQRRSPRSDCCATHQGETDNSRVQPRVQQEAPPRPTLGLGLRRRSPPRPTPGLSLGRNRVLARPRPRPWKEVSASPDPRARPQPRPREESRPRPTLASASGEVSASPDLGLGPTTP